MNIVQRGNNEFKVYVNVDGAYIADPSDSLIIDKYVRPASSFYYYNNGDEPAAAAGWNNFMKGLAEEGTENTVKLAAITAGLTTVEDAAFFFNGDPEAGTGWLDNGPSDRRFILNNGPFELGVSDGTGKFGDPGYNSTVFGVFTSFGSSATNSVTQLKIDDNIIQGAFNAAFELTPNPPAPAVTVISEDQKLSFTWVEGSVTFKGGQVYTESYNLDDYSFQGYEIVQFESANTAGSENYKLIATYDLVDGVTTVVDKAFVSAIGDTVVTIVLLASDNGVLNNIQITQDLYSASNVPKLLNYSPYSFGVRAIAYNPDPDANPATKGASKIKKGEWAVGLTNLLPKKVEVGSNLGYETGGNASATRVGPPSSGGVVAKVVDPLLTKAATYTGIFYTLQADKAHPGVPGDVISAGELVWRVDRLLDGVTTTVVADMPQWLGDDVYESNVYSRVADGVLWSAYGPTLDITHFSVTANADGPLDPPDPGNFAFNSNGFPTFEGDDRPDASRQQANGSTWGIHQGLDPTQFLYTNYIKVSILDQNGWGQLIPFDFEIRFTAGPNKGYDTANGALVDIPFEVWNVDLGVRMLVEFIDANNTGAFDFIDGVDHAVSGGTNDPYTESFFVFNPSDASAGSAGYDAWVAGNGTSGKGEKIIGNQTFVNWNGGTVASGVYDALMPETGTIFKITTNDANSDAVTDVFDIAAPVLKDASLAQQRFTDQVNVWPNPYRGWHELQSNTGGFMEFINLPIVETNDPVRVQIYNLSGSLVKNLTYTGQSGTLRWQLDNDANLKIASGIYVAYLKYRGSHKIIKMAVNIGENRPKTF